MGMRIPEGKGPYSVGCTDLMTGYGIQVLITAIINKPQFYITNNAK